MTNNSCYHCGDEIIGKVFVQDTREFCCQGCKSVYILLHENNLDSFYHFYEHPVDFTQKSKWIVAMPRTIVSNYLIQ